MLSVLQKQSSVQREELLMLTHQDCAGCCRLGEVTDGPASAQLRVCCGEVVLVLVISPPVPHLA